MSVGESSDFSYSASRYSYSYSKTRESIQGDRLFKEAGTPVFGPNINYIPIRPFEHEYPRMVEPYFEKYLRRVDPSVDPMEQLVSQSEAFMNWASSIDSAQTLVLHDPYTWTLREVLKHISDCERVFAFRALWIARGGNDSLPSFDEHVFLANSSANEASWLDLIEEFSSVRSASLTLFKNLPEPLWHRRGMAAGFELDVRMLHGMIVGHLDHHQSIMRKRLAT